MAKVILSIHDVTPRFRNEMEVIFNHFSALPMSVLVTPLWDGLHQIDKSFADMVRDKDKVLHGLTHLAKERDIFGKMFALSKRSDREFYNLSPSETNLRLTLGKTLFEDAFGETPQGFIPPTWYHNSFSIMAAKANGFKYTENASHFIRLQEDIYQKAIPVCLDYGNNAMLEKIMTYGWRFLLKNTTPDLVRISVHPSDVTNGYLPHFDTMINILKDKNYEFTTYREMMNT